MRAFLLALTLMSGFSFAQEELPPRHTIEFKLEVRTSWRRNAYGFKCNEVAERSTELLKALGATNIAVGCFGGIDPRHPSFADARVVAVFATPTPKGTTTTTRTLSSDQEDMCVIDWELLHAAIPKFEGMEILSKQTTCFRASNESAAWSMELSVTE